ERLGGEAAFAGVDVRFLRGDHPDPDSQEAASALLRITVLDPDPVKVGRAFSGAVVEMALASYPGFYATTPPAGESAYSRFWPALVPADVLLPRVIDEHGAVIPIPLPPEGPPGPPLPLPPETAGAFEEGPSRRLPLGTILGARSGDKGSHAC